MIITVDVGNSWIHIGYFTESRLFVQKITTSPLRKASEYSYKVKNFLSENDIEKEGISVIISSVVGGYAPVLTETFEGLSSREKINVITFGYGMKSGLTFNINNPEEVGTDRIANAVGAYEIYKSAVAVSDFGTATSLSLVDANANFIGGAIMPGIELMNDALGSRTSRLKKVPIQPPASALGKDTKACILSGLFYGTAGGTERILSEIETELGTEFNLVVTGGRGPAMARFMRRPHKVIPNLTLEGLRILYEKNRPS